jgi:alpha-acetolactate decarboxylase
MIVLDGKLFQIQGTGKVSEAPTAAEVPFAVLTRFSPEVDQGLDAIADFSDLQKHCDALRNSGNIFYAFRLVSPNPRPGNCFRGQLNLDQDPDPCQSRLQNK